MIMAKSMICADCTETAGETVRFLLPLLPRHPLGERTLAHFRAHGFKLHSISKVISTQEERQPLLGIDPYLQTAGGGVGQYFDPFEDIKPFEMVACMDDLSTMLNTHSNEMGWYLPDNISEGSSDSRETEGPLKEESPVTDGERTVEEPTIFDNEAPLQKVLADVYVSHTKATIPVANLGRKVKAQLGIQSEKKVGKVVIDFSENTIQVFPGRKRKSKDFQISEFFQYGDWLTTCCDRPSGVEDSISSGDKLPFVDRAPTELVVRPGEIRMGVDRVLSENGYRVAYDKAGKQLYKLRHLNYSDVLGKPS